MNGRPDSAIADLQRAYLVGVNLQEAVLIGANLHGADLMNARNPTQEQLKYTCADETIRLPRGLITRACGLPPR
jgi:hypothetical protein